MLVQDMRFPRLRVLIPRIDEPDPASRYPGIPATLLDFRWCSTIALNDSPGSSSGIMRPGSGRPMRRGSRARRTVLAGSWRAASAASGTSGTAGAGDRRYYYIPMCNMHATYRILYIYCTVHDYGRYPRHPDSALGPTGQSGAGFTPAVFCPSTTHQVLLYSSLAPLLPLQSLSFPPFSPPHTVVVVRPRRFLWRACSLSCFRRFSRLDLSTAVCESASEPSDNCLPVSTFPFAPSVFFCWNR